MPNNAKVYAHYGPSECCGIVDYQEARLEGLQAVLMKDGHNVELIQIRDQNTVELWVNGENVFECRITDLDYGGDGELDPLCARALDKVKAAF